MYEEANSPYFKAYDPEFQLKSNLSHILHHADMLASRVEYDKWRYDNGVDIVTNDSTSNASETPAKKNKPDVERFEELFEEIT